MDRSDHFFFFFWDWKFDYRSQLVIWHYFWVNKNKKTNKALISLAIRKQKKSPLVVNLPRNNAKLLTDYREYFMFLYITYIKRIINNITVYGIIIYFNLSKEKYKPVI